MNYVPAVAYHFCLLLPTAFTQPGYHLLAEAVCLSLSREEADVTQKCDKKAIVISASRNRHYCASCFFLALKTRRSLGPKSQEEEILFGASTYVKELR